MLTDKQIEYGIRERLGEQAGDAYINSKPKPPLGVEPKYIVENRRIYDLASAIVRQFEGNVDYIPNLDLIAEWSIEITDRVMSLKDSEG